MTSGSGGHGVIDAVATIAQEGAPAGTGTEAAAFVRHYYDRVADEDLERARPDNLYGAAMAHRRAGDVRPPGTSVVRICNPDLDADGWQSAHTVIDIVADDMPFLVDSVTMVLAARHVGIHVVVHPTLMVQRDADGRFAGLGGDHPEAWIHFEVDRQGAKDGRDALAADIRRSLEEVRLVVDDWPAMRDQALALVAEVEAGVPVSEVEAADAAALLRWMAADEFTFLGFREYDLAVEDGHEVLRGRPGTGLGLLRDEHHPPTAKRLDQLPELVRQKVHEPHLLVVTKANSRSTVHRADYFAYVGVKRIGPDGRVLGERRFLGLWGATTYRSTTDEIPLIGRKVAAVRRRAGLAPASHGGRELWNVLETYPRDDLFQISEDELLATALEILNLQERRQLRLFARRDDYGRFVSCLIYVPRERYSTTIVERMEEILLAGFGGVSAEYDSSITASVLARLHVLVFVGEDAPTDVDIGDIERRLATVTRWWLDDLRDALVDARGEEAGLALFARAADAFPAAYREAFGSAAAVKDLERLDRLADGGEDVVTALYQRFDGSAAGELRLKLYSRQAITLSSVLPVLEQMGVQVVDERPYELRPSGAATAWIYDFGLLAPGGAPAEPADPRRIPGDLRVGVARRDRERRLQPPRARRRSLRHADHHPAGLREVPPPDRPHLQPELRGGDARRSSRHRQAPRRALHRALRSPPRRQPGPRVRRHRGGDHRGPRPGGQPRPGPHPARLPRPRAGDGAHERVPPRCCRRAPAGTRVQARSRARCPTSRCPDPGSRSGCTPPTSKGSTCAAVRWRAAASAGATGGRTSAPRCSA